MKKAKDEYERLNSKQFWTWQEQQNTEDLIKDLKGQISDLEHNLNYQKSHTETLSRKFADCAQEHESTLQNYQQEQSAHQEATIRRQNNQIELDTLKKQHEELTAELLHL